MCVCVYIKNYKREQVRIMNQDEEKKKKKNTGFTK